MKINSFMYQPLQVEVENFTVDGSIMPIFSSPTFKPKSMKLIAEFSSKLDISNFMAEILGHSKNLIDVDDGYLYHCYFSGSSTPSSEYWNNCYRVEFEFLVIQTGILIQKSLPKVANLVINKGNYKSECTYVIKARQDLSSFTIGNVLIRNIKAGDKVIIDGMMKKVYSQRERNKYGDCIFYDNTFPCLQPGQNMINRDDGDVEVLVFYYPVYI